MHALCAGLNTLYATCLAPEQEASLDDLQLETLHICGLPALRRLRMKATLFLPPTLPEGKCTTLGSTDVLELRDLPALTASGVGVALSTLAWDL